MAVTKVVRAFLLLSIPALIAGCQGDASPFGQTKKPDPSAQDTAPGTAAQTQVVPASARSVKLVDRDIEAPEVFSVTDTALWDGRPSLGGVWVASPDAIDPERVILRNAANGKFVIGALFRRERDNPGPTLQISSDAAAALGLLAGQPGKISVTALRREEAPVTAPDSSKPILDAAETVETETLPATPEGATTAATAVTAPAGEVSAERAEAKAKGFTLFKKRKPKSDGPVAPVVSSEPVAASQAPAVTSAAPATKPAEASKAPAAAPAKGGLIQIGIFSVEANAKRAVDTLAKAGISAAVRQETAQGKAFWSVTATGGADTLAKIKAAGFADAYQLKRG